MNMFSENQPHYVFNLHFAIIHFAFRHKGRAIPIVRMGASDVFKDIRKQCFLN